MNHIITEETARALLKVIAYWARRDEGADGDPKLSLEEGNLLCSFVDRVNDKDGPELIRLYQEAARQEYQSDGEVEVDEDVAVVSMGDDPGAYVEAWVWVGWDAHPEIEEKVKELAH